MKTLSAAGPRFAQAPADAGGGSGTTDTGKDLGGGQEGSSSASETTETAKAAPVVPGKDGGTDSKAADTSKEGKKTESTKADEAYKLELKLPKDALVDESYMGKFTPLAEKHKISSEVANELALLHSADVKSRVDAWAEQGKKWGEELKADKEFGGSNYDASASDVQKTLLRFKGEPFVEDLKKFGLENLPSLNRFLARVGKATREDSSHVETSSAPAPTTRQERLGRRYDHPDSKRVREGSL